MLGMSFGYVHGIGFVPQNRILQKVFSPIVAWPVMSFGSWMVFIA
ncbi:MAG: cytochrome bd biosynthesis protein, partial [Burkholderiaceae bacterium]|nr:cytochrome bd biosynthesis protein [Burkholderiaceae bacterium]